MKYLLDTDICIDIIRGQPKAVAERFRRLRSGDVGISSIALAELAFGAAHGKSPRNRARLETFIAPLSIVDFGQEAALVYGDVRADLYGRGTPIGPIDMLIAAHALALDVTLVTNNEREFKRVPGLRVENWTA